MRIKRWLIFVAVVATGSVFGWSYLRGAAAPQYQTAPVTRGSVDATVAATGTCNAVVTVQVGSQVSGNIKALYADFNTKVSKGQLVALIDPEIFQAKVNQARANLDKDGGLPSGHALSYISARLLELGNLPLADAIDDALLKHGIPPASVRHLLFTFSGNHPEAMLTASLQAYPGAFHQWGIGLCVDGHAAFIGAVYDQVIANANNA